MESLKLRVMKYTEELLFTNFALIMITFLLLTSVFSHNFIALGYFVFSMILCFNYRNFFTDTKARDNQLLILQYFLLPYLLIDIAAQLCTQIPFESSAGEQTMLKTIGFVQVWKYFPETIFLSETIAEKVTVTASTSLTILFLKAVVYFVIQIQVNTIISP